MRREQEHSYGNDKFASAIAAAAFAIHMLEESQKNIREESDILINKERTWNEESIRPSRSGSKLGPLRHDRLANSWFVRGVNSSFNQDDQIKRGKVRRERKTESKEDAWEKSEMEKIKKRYEKIEDGIIAWEKESKMISKLQYNKKKSELELRKDRNLKHYNMKVARIEHIAEEAKAQVKEKRKNEELNAKKRAEKIRAANKAKLVCCYCF